MHPLRQQIAQCAIDQPVPPHAALAHEDPSLDLHGKVAFAARIVAGMAAMLLAIVDHDKPGGGQGGAQPLFDFGRYRAGFKLGHASYIAGLREFGRLAEGERRQQRFHGRVPGERQCSAPGCDEAGEFRAPADGRRSGFDGPGDWQWLCLDHVREFNQRYNYFSGMSADEIAAEQRPYAGWERETRAFATAGADRPPRWADFSDPLDAIQARFRGGVAGAGEQRRDGKPLSGEDRRAFKTLGLDIDADRRALRQAYSDLVRRYHPDRNGGDRSHERQLSDVIAAYQRLKGSPAFA